MPAKINVKDRLVGNTIDLSLSELQEVPVRDIVAVKKGIIVDLSNNRLVTLGKNFSSLSHLVQLDLSKNLLKELPDDFGELTSLKRLDLYGNKLQHLPLSFSQLKALKWLDLKDNPLVPRLAEIAGPCEDNKDCEECAHNVVEALSRTALEIEEERKRRLKEQLKEREREEQELLAKKKELDNAKKRNKNKKGNTKNEKPTLPSAKNSAVKETLSKDNIPKQNTSKERPPKENIVKKPLPQETAMKNQSQPAQLNRKSKKQPGGLCARLVLGCVWLFLFGMLAVVSIVTFALWDRTTFEMSASRLGPQGGAVAKFVLQTIIGLTTN